jgi:DNA gyrase subunit A
LSEYPVKGRGAGGVSTIDKGALQAIGVIAAARVVRQEDDLTIISTNGVVLRTKVTDIRRSGRATRGVVLMMLQEGDSLASLARIASADLIRAGAAQG